MKIFTKSVIALLLAFATFFVKDASGQSVLNPADTVYTYNSSSPAGSRTNPSQPAANTIGRWIRTVRMSWNTSAWKCYIYNGVQFRLRFPTTYNPSANDGKRYPVLVFFHGLGEAGVQTDNEYQLYHGGTVFENRVNTGAFDGYVLCLQSNGSWGAQHDVYVKAILEYMVANNKLDPFRISVNGLSAGGYNSWNYMETYPQFCASALPMSGISIYDQQYVQSYKYTPIWYFQGGLDGAPAQNTADQTTAVINNAGGNLRYTIYPDLGHGTWDRAWSETDFFPWISRVYMANPWTLKGRTQFCPGDPINLTVGVAPGLAGYQWRKDGVVIPGATTNSINVTSVGTYDCRVLYTNTQYGNSIWSDWSRVPVVISLKAPTVTPDIAVAGLQSKVIPSPAGPSVTLTEPSGYISYKWTKQGDTTTLGNNQTFTVNLPGNYVARVTEQFGCSTNGSNPFTVINANGPNKPDAATGLVASTLSQTKVLLNWSQNPSPAFNETNFEIYQSTSPGGPYKLVDITGADITKDTVDGLNSGTRYYYIVRAVNGTGASASSNEASAQTIADVQAPTAPTSLTVVGTTRSSISVAWTAATDNVAVTGYEIYVNGQKAYTVTDPTITNFTVYGLNQGQNYAISVKAKDGAGNASPSSNQVSAVPLLAGLPYKYYQIPTSSTVLPDFTTLTPKGQGLVPNVTITGLGYTETSYYAYLWQGYIIIPTTGNYTFRTTSDDGSRMWLGALNGIPSPYDFAATPLINNDGGHGSATVTSATKNLTAGIYPIAIAYMNLTGGASMGITWKTPSSGTSYVTVPNTAFSDAPVNNGSAPAIPSNLIAKAPSYNTVNLTWRDLSNNETGFEIWRSTSATTGFTTVGTTAANATTFTDNTVAPNTKYYYQIRSINTYGQSAFVSSIIEADWKFNNNYIDSSGNGRTLTSGGSPTFDNTAAGHIEGSHAVKLNGTSQNISIPNTNSFLQEAYTQRTFSVWIKPTVTTGTYRVIFDAGGSDDGVCLLLNNNRLIAGVASNSQKDSVSTAFTNTTTWSHVAVVYQGDSLQLYVNGVLAAQKTNLSFNALTTTSNAARIGQVSGSHALNINSSTMYSGSIDEFLIFNTALDAAAVASVKNFGTDGAVSFTTTPNTPAAPAAPTGLTATAISPSSIQVSWTNSAVNAANIQLYRSNGDNQSYVLWATLAGNATSFTDGSLFPNAKYYYKVNAINAGGTSAYSNEGNATTLGIAPVITDLVSTQVRYGSSTTIQLSATSANGGLLTFSSPNLPASGFATISNTSNTTANLVLNPAITDQGTYNLSIIVSDAFGGKDTTQFTLVVNDQYAPTVDTIADYTMYEGDSLLIPITGRNQNPADILTMAVSGAPTAFTVTQTGNGTANLVLKPNYAGSGNYSVKVTVNDANGLFANRNFNLTVNDKDPNTRVKMHINGGDSTVPGWNNLSNYISGGFKDENGQTTTMSLDLEPAWWWNTKPIAALGANTGNNSGIYPDGVLKDYYFFGIWGGPDTPVATLGGLDPASRYDLTFFGSSSWDGVSDNGWTVYSAGGQSAALHVHRNSTQAVTLSGILPDASGNIAWRMWKKDGNTPLGYFNALVVTKIFDDGTAPAAPVQLFAQNAPTQGGVKLTWVDKAYNELGYTIIRSTAAAGPYAPVGTVGTKAITFVDTTVSGGVTYWYRVYATNGTGQSPYTDSVSITTTNRIPKINPISNVTLTSGQSATVTVTTVDDATDHQTLTASNLPSFVSFVDNGNGTGTITVAPGAGDNGVYTGLTVKTTDMSDSSASTTFSVFVVEQNVSNTYLNFSDTAVAPKPWNNLLGIPFAGTTISNLVDDGGANTGISVQIQGGFDGVVGHGMRPRNGQNVYPEAVTSTGYFAYSTDQRGLLISGLNPSKTYNFIVFASYFDNSDCTTKFGMNGQTQVLNAAFNTSKTVSFNGVVPAANGQVTLTIAKNSTSSFIAVISSLVIQAYTPAQIQPVMAPADLRMIDNTKTSVTVQWQDRADSETAYQVWRATSSAGPYSLRATLPANATSYKDSNLTSDAYYYYTVRAVKNASYTSYSNTVATYTYGSIVNIAFNSATTTQAPFPWNNLANVPELGYTWNNFINDLGQPTNIGMIESGDGWAGIYNAGGVNTGNNSGIFPDNAMMNSYVLFPGQHGKVTVTGLNLSKAHDFYFFASVVGTYDGSSIYTVNGRTTVLNGTLNQTKTMPLFNIVPDGAGQADIDVDPYTSNSQFGMLNVLQIKSHTLNSSNPPTAPASGGGGGQAVANGASTQFTTASSNLDGLKELTAYPNPFKDAFTLAVQTSSNDKVVVSMSDMSGKIVYQKQFEGLVQGTNLLRIQPVSPVPAGVYFVTLTYTKTGARQTIKVIKD